mmetsp:Transcript_24293/g.65881  ORF Transcript_24293/g.65881 Transcript_24293/m.65881 type:complete len:391 (-) Transcript_24293:296-1468(-)
MGNASAKQRSTSSNTDPPKATAATEAKAPRAHYELPEKDLLERVLDSAAELGASPCSTVLLEAARYSMREESESFTPVNVDHGSYRGEDNEVSNSSSTALTCILPVDVAPAPSEEALPPCSSNTCRDFVILRHGDVVASSNICTDFVVLVQGQVIASSNHCTAFVLLDDEGRVVGSSNPCTCFVLGCPPSLSVKTAHSPDEAGLVCDVMFVGTHKKAGNPFDPELSYEPNRRYRALQKQARIKVPRGFKSTEHALALRQSCPTFEYRSDESARIKLPRGFKSSEHLEALRQSCPVKPASFSSSRSNSTTSTDGDSQLKARRRSRAGKQEQHEVAAMLFGCPELPSPTTKHLKQQESLAFMAKAEMRSRSTHFVQAAQRAPRLFHRPRSRR